jgi:hypothetical protein
MKQSFIRGTVLPQLLVANLIIGLLAVTGMYLLPNSSGTNLSLIPTTFISKPGDTFSVQVLTTSDVPVNAFKGTVSFNEKVLSVESINYNTSLADLWAEEPWYQSGGGSISFAGGTTRPGGFTGTESLLTITFKSLNSGNGDLMLTDTQILMHDGLGTEAALTDYIDTLFVVASGTTEEAVVHKTESLTDVTVLDKLPQSDINSDGKVNMIDVSLFLVYLPTNNHKGDLNMDGKVNSADLSIILGARSE